MLKSINQSNKARIKALEITRKVNASHIGSIFSIIDLISVMFFEELSETKRPLFDPTGENFILSKGHAGLAFYIGLNQLKIISDLELESYYMNGSLLSGHVSHYGVQGISFSTGSLGHGLPHAVGRSIGKKKSGDQTPIIALLSDGEMNEGTTWESALIASHLGLNNLLVIIDYNKMQSLGRTNDTLNLEPLKDKWVAFGFNVIEVDGHIHNDILISFNEYIKYKNNNSLPTVIIANTIKGKGVSFMENNILYHYIPVRTEYDSALKELLNNEK